MLDMNVKDAGLHVSYARQMPTETMGDRIRQLRIARGLTQPALGELCGVTKSAVSQWEDGSTKNIKLEVFLRLLSALLTDFQYLVWGPDRAPGPSSGRVHRYGTVR